MRNGLSMTMHAGKHDTLSVYVISIPITKPRHYHRVCVHVPISAPNKQLFDCMGLHLETLSSE